MQYAVLAVIVSVSVASSSRAADTVAFVAKSSNYSMLTFLNPTSGKQIRGESLGFDATSGAVFSTDGSIAYVPALVSYHYVLIGFDLATGEQIGSLPVEGGGDNSALRGRVCRTRLR